MSRDLIHRRQFLAHSAIASAAATSGLRAISAFGKESPKGLLLSSSEYSWTVLYQRDNRNFRESLETSLKDLPKSEVNGLEPSITKPEELDMLAPLLKTNNLEIRSLYVNSTLHDPKQVDQSIAQLLAIGRRAETYGTRIIVTNPSPLPRGGPENKDDSQLKTQAAALNKLGRELRSLGLRLAYHNHDIELRQAAREFHHMMLGTDPKLVFLCLDAHWMYRGAGNSSVALFDILKLYGSRVIEVHLRQSVNNVWAETFGEGDIDYSSLAEHLLRNGVKPHFVLEVAVEKGTPKTLDPVEVHRRSAEYARKIFERFHS